MKKVQLNITLYDANLLDRLRARYVQETQGWPYPVSFNRWMNLKLQALVAVMKVKL